jgi:hypothetical protein
MIVDLWLKLEKKSYCKSHYPRNVWIKKYAVASYFSRQQNVSQCHMANPRLNDTTTRLVNDTTHKVGQWHNMPRHLSAYELYNLTQNALINNTTGKLSFNGSWRILNHKITRKLLSMFITWEKKYVHLAHQPRLLKSRWFLFHLKICKTIRHKLTP